MRKTINNLIISPDSKSRGRTLAEIAKDGPAKQASSILRQRPLTGNLITLAKYRGDQGRVNTGLSQEEAVKQANEKGLTIASNLFADDDLVNKDGYHLRTDTYFIWTGVMAAYEKPGVALRSTITYTDPDSKITYFFNVPPKFKGKKNCILCIAHGFLANGTPTFKHTQTQDGVLIEVADPSLISLIKNFNKDNGCHLPEPQFGIPVGANSDAKNTAARGFYRLNGSYIGLVARGCDSWDIWERDVEIHLKPSARLGVLAFE